MPITRDDYLAEYRRLLLEPRGRPWVKTDGNRGVERLMQEAKTTLETNHDLWFMGPIAREAWTSLGGKGRLTLKTLRGLPK